MATAKRIHVVINPAAGRAEPILSTLNDVFRAHEVDWDISITRTFGDATRFARQAADAGFEPLSPDEEVALRAAIDHLEPLRTELPERFPGTELLVAGVLLHAAAGTARARAEISIVGLGSLLGIVALSGVVVNDSLVFVAAANRYRAQRMPPIHKRLLAAWKLKARRARDYEKLERAAYKEMSWEEKCDLETGHLTDEELAEEVSRLIDDKMYLRKS